MVGAVFFAASAFARQSHVPLQEFQGIWAGDGAHCKWPEEFLYVFDRDTVRIPYRGIQEPDRVCRILSVKSARPFWKLRLSCNHSDPESRLPKPFETSLTLRVSNDRYRVTFESEPTLGLPSRTDDLRFCRELGENPPPLQCMNDNGKLIDCPP